MPETGYYESVPRPESIEALLRYLHGNPVVTEIEEIGPQVIQVTRVGKSTLTVFMTNIYIVSESDVAEISADHRVNAIVTMSAWNGYTRDAKTAAHTKGIGLFKFKEFLGAVYYEGKHFLDYTPPDPDRKRRRPRP